MQIIKNYTKNLFTTAILTAYAAGAVAAGDTLTGGFSTATTATARTTATIGPGGANPLPANQTTPASVFSVASGLQSPNGRYDQNVSGTGFAFSSAQHGSSRNYLQQAQVGEATYSNGSFSSAAQSILTQTTVINNSTGSTQNLRATVSIDKGLVARANTLGNYPANSPQYDISSISWLMKLNGVIVAGTGISVSGKDTVFFGGSPYSMQPTNFNLAATQGYDRGDRLGLVTADPSTFFSFQRWDAQSFTFDLFNVLGGSNTLEILSEVSAVTSGGYTSTLFGSGPSNGRGPLTNFAYFGDPLAFASGLGSQGFSLSLGAPTASSSSGGPGSSGVPSPDSALLLLAGAVAVLTARKFAAAKG